MPKPVNWLYGINVIACLNDLAERSKNGIHPFSECTHANEDVWGKGIVYMDEDSTFGPNAVLADVIIDADRHEAVQSHARFVDNLCDNEITTAIYAHKLRKDGADVWGVMFEVCVEDVQKRFVIYDGHWYAPNHAIIE